MDSVVLDRHAQGLAEVIHQLGPIHRESVLIILQEVTASEEAAGQVLAYALAHGFVEAHDKNIRRRGVADG